ncbi:substrate-binding domain-containing protein [Psychromicrobium sp. YIM B11713]|uniref:substrate-binding domain-containing protein n=1 Tax=Psychromicrobium sp. YIM B11713 TaxID=3145233 RepID=UPI00374E325F
MTSSSRSQRFNRQSAGVLAALTVILTFGVVLAPPAAALDRVSGNGSSWAGNAVNQWVTDVKAQGQTVDFTPDGSSSGRKNFATGLSDFAISEIPYRGDTADKQDTNFPNFKYSMLPVVAGGTSFMYNVNVGGKRFENLKLSQEALAKIFSGQISQWNDPAIAKTNPGIALPAQRITVVVRSDGSGATAQFTLWMLRQYPQHYAALCAKTHCNPKAATSYFPYQGLANFTAQSGSNGVTTYTTNTPYTINYDEFSYAKGVGFPVANIQNAAGFYTVPTDTAVAVALTKAVINNDPNSANYLSQDLSQVYSYGDPRTYPISAYSYMIAPAQLQGNFSKGKGAALARFASYSLCEGQRTMGSLGYSPLPMNLVLAAMEQVRKIPGIDAETTAKISATEQSAKTSSGNPCNNPTFKPGDKPNINQLVRTAPFPDGCDARCQAPWTGASAAANGGPGSGPGATKQDNTPAGPKNNNGPAGTNGPTAGSKTSKAPTAAGAPAAGNCDPDTGECSGGGTTDSGSGEPVAAVPLVLAGENGWGSPQTMLIVAGIILLGLLLAPPLTARLVAGRRSGSGSRKP